MGRGVESLREVASNKPHAARTDFRSISLLGGDDFMTVLASFEFVQDLVIVHWTCWSIAAGLALVALALAYRRRSRRTSKWCAIAAIVASIPFSLAAVDAIRMLGVSGFALLFLLLELAPLLVAVVALRIISLSPIEK